MEIKTKSVPITPLAKPCIYIGELTSVYFVADAPQGTVSINGATVVVDFYFNCRHWIYNRNLPDMTAADTGFSALCLGDTVIVFKIGSTYTVVGRHNPDITGVLRQPCWPVFDSSKAFAVAPLSVTDQTQTWKSPFLIPNSTPFDFVNPQVDVFGETRPLGTPGSAITALGEHIRLITEHEVDTEIYYVAHTLHEVLSAAPYGVYLCPATTENSRYFLGRKVTYNSTVSRLMLDDMAIITSIVDAGSLNVLTFTKDGYKVYVNTFSKLLDRIQTIYGTVHQIELKVGYYESGRADFLFCLTKLLLAGGAQPITSLPEYTTGQFSSIILDREILSVANSGLAICADTGSMKLIFYSLGDGGYTPIAHCYEVLCAFDANSAGLASTTVVEQSHDHWRPLVTGGGTTGYLFNPTHYTQNDFNYYGEVTCSPMIMSGPDYPSVIGGDHTFTGGIHGASGAFVSKNVPTISSYMNSYGYLSYYVSHWYRELKFSLDSAIIYKHDGVEITRGISVINYDIEQSITHTANATTQGAPIVSDSLSFLAEMTFSEVHWLAIRPELEFYVFVEVQVFTDFEPYKTWPTAPVVANMYAWYRGDKVLLSTKSIYWPQDPTPAEWSDLYNSIDQAVGFDGAESRVPDPYIPIGPVLQPDGSTYLLGMSVAKWDPTWGASSSGVWVRLPRMYWQPSQVYDAYVDNQKDHAVHSNSGIPDRYKNVLYAEFPNFYFSPDLDNETGTYWRPVLDLYNTTTQLYKGYTDHWTYLANSNEINQKYFGIDDNTYSAARPFTPAMLYYKGTVALGKPQFFGDHLYVTIPDVFTSGLVHEFFSGPSDMLNKIKAAINVGNPSDVMFTTNVS